MNEAYQPTTVTVRALLAHFHSVLDQAQRTGEPVIIALRRRTPAGVLLGYETWQALANGQPSIQAAASALQTELAAERQRNSKLAADLAAARQRMTELEAELARPRPSGEVGATWGVTPPPAASARSSEAGLSWGTTASTAPPAISGWGRS